MKVIQGLFTSDNTTLLTDKIPNEILSLMVCTAAAVVFLLALN